jgi:DNA-binding response OmpR family regulator
MEFMNANYCFLRGITTLKHTMNKVLLIEDDDGIITPLSLYIEQSGYEVILCQDGGDALDIFHIEKPDILILDINLP